MNEDEPMDISSREINFRCAETGAESCGCKPLGQWLVNNVPRGAKIPLPDRNEPDREIPFSDMK